MIAYPADMAVAERAIALADEFVERFPYDEHGYNQRAEIDICLNRRDEAVAYLKHAILEVHPDERDSRSSLLAAQCCMTLLDILEETNEYDFIIEICDRGLRSTAQTQPSSSTASFMYARRSHSNAKGVQREFPARPTRCSRRSSAIRRPMTDVGRRLPLHDYAALCCPARACGGEQVPPARGAPACCQRETDREWKKARGGRENRAAAGLWA